MLSLVRAVLFPNRGDKLADFSSVALGLLGATVLGTRSYRWPDGPCLTGSPEHGLLRHGPSTARSGSYRAWVGTVNVVPGPAQHGPVHVVLGPAHPDRTCCMC
jgi:hypothetical protein